MRNRFLNIHKSLFLVSLSILLYILFLLISNIFYGFDITDESFYLLQAQHQDEVYPVIRRSGYYTGILYYLSMDNLAYHRLFGILLLFGSAIWFAVELYKYISKSFNYHMTIMDKLFFIVSICTGVFAYYRSWLLTPSYNWLALISTILVLGSLFSIVNKKDKIYTKYLTFNYFFISFSLNMAFMAKPTTAIVLAVIIFFFSIVEYRHINIKKAFTTIFILTTLIAIGHIIILEGNLTDYYQRLQESLLRMSLLDPRYTLENRFFTTIDLFRASFGKYIYLFQIIIFITVALIMRYKKIYLRVSTILIFFIFTGYIFFLFKYGIQSNFKLLWLKTAELLFESILLFLFFASTIKQEKITLDISKKIVSISFIFIISSIAYSFGTNGNIIYAMSGSLMFIIAAIVVVHYFLDKLFKTNIFLPLVSVFISISVLFVLQNAYNNPYRLITNIADQNQKVDLLGGLYVDEVNKKYIETLKRIKEKYTKSNQKITLLDMTGGSPGANVILDADFFGEPWLAGAYPGSNKSLKMILESYRGSKKLKEAWILIAPTGIRKLDLNILNQLGLDFPKNYIKIGILKTAHRQEIQELWKPNNSQILK